MKKVFSILISIYLLCFFIPLSANAEEIVRENITIDKYDFASSGIARFSDEVELFGARYAYDQKVVMFRNFLLERITNMEEYKNELSLGEYSYSDDELPSDILFVDLSEFTAFSLYLDSENITETLDLLSDVAKDMYDKSPRTFWADTQFVYSYRTSDYKLLEIGIALDCGVKFDVSAGLEPVIEKTNALMAEFDAYVTGVCDLIPEYYTDYEKILFVNDYLCVNYRYDNDYIIHDAYTFFKEGKGVCSSYTFAFMAIMDELGLRCDSVPSEEMDHIWNLVELDDKWYHVDVTWNDPSFSDVDMDTMGLAQHRYFLLSTECMRDGMHQHIGFDVESYGYEFGTEYDDVKVDLSQAFETSFIELNGKWYNTAYNANDWSCGLYAFDSPVFSEIDEEALGTPIYEMSHWGYVSCFSYLAKYKNMILFNTKDAVYSFDGENFNEIYVPEKSSSQKIYGFDIKDGNIRVQLSENPNKSGMKNAIVKTISLREAIEPEITVEDYYKTSGETKICSSKAARATLVFASYDGNGRMIDCKLSDCNLLKGTYTYAPPKSLEISGAESVKIMVVENVINLRPLCESLVKALNS